MQFLREYGLVKGNCFILMPYGRKKLSESDSKPFDWDRHYETVIERAIKQAGMRPIRAADFSGTTQGLMDNVWRGLQEADIVVADITGLNPNVFYELGLAHAIGKRVVLLARIGENIPADISYTRQILYNLDETAGALKFIDDLVRDVKAAQNEPAREMMLQPFGPYSVEQVDGIIIHVMARFAVVETLDGRKAVLESEDVSYRWLSPDLTRLFKVGSRVRGAFVTIAGKTKYSLIATQDNPWLSVESEFPAGKSFLAKVSNCNPEFGVSVNVKRDVFGFIPKAKLSPDVVLNVGDEVQVETVWIDPARRKMELKFIKRERSVMDEKWEPPHAVGEKLEGVVVRLGPKYLLAKLPKCTGILHISQMTSDFLDKFEGGHIQIGSSSIFEVAELDWSKRQVRLRNID